MFIEAYLTSDYVGRHQEIATPSANVSGERKDCVITTTNSRSYLVDMSSSESGAFVCVDRSSGAPLRCRFYPMSTFVRQLALLVTLREGLSRPLEIFRLSQGEAFVLYARTYGDLHSYLKRRKNLPEATAAEYFRQIVHLVRSAHERNISLRDLKLKKFAFADETRITLLLTDLDDAVLLPDGTEMLEDRHGCPAYVAPEMLVPNVYSGKAADMWSVGIILYTLLVGHYPFFDISPQALFFKIRSGHYFIPEHVSYLARSLISSLLSYDPQRRPGPEAVLAHPWLVNPPTSPESLPPLQDQLVPGNKLL